MDWNEWRHSALMMAQKDFLYLKREDFDKLDALVRAAEEYDRNSECRNDCYSCMHNEEYVEKLFAALKNLGLGGEG